MRPSCKGMTSLHLKRCQKPTFISLVKLKQADWLQARKEPRWRIKTNRPAAVRQQEQPHGHIRGGSVSQVNQNKGTGLTQKCQVYSLLLAIRIQHLFQLSRLCDRILFWWKNWRKILPLEVVVRKRRLIDYGVIQRTRWENCLKITQNVAYEFWHFGIFHQFLSY